MWGKLIGLTLGSEIFGRFGGMLGLLIGHIIDKSSHLNIGHFQSANGSQELIFRKTLFGLCGHLAKIDGPVNTLEINVVRAIMGKLSLPEFARQQAMEWFYQGKQNNYNIINNLNVYCQARFGLASHRLLLEMLVQTAIADGALVPAEYKILTIVCQQINLSANYLNFLMLKYHSGFKQEQGRSNYNWHRQSSHSQSSSLDLRSAYQTLGLVDGASNIEVKKAYRKLINKYHPDKTAAQNLSDTEIRNIQEKAKKITAAYNLIKQNKDFK